MFKNFNWKRYIIHLAISWGIFAFTMGVVSEFKSLAKEDGVWIYMGKLSDPETIFYYQRNGIRVNSSGNIVLSMKIVIENIGSIYTVWEFDCKNKTIRRISVGDSMRSMINIKDDWITPPDDSMGMKLLKRLCSTGGKINA